MTYTPSAMTLQVRRNDLDSQAHVNHATVLEYLETGRHDWMRKNQVQLVPGVMAIVARVEVNYLRAISCDTVRVETSLQEELHADELNYKVTFRQVVTLDKSSAAAGLTAVEAIIQVGFVSVEHGNLLSTQESIAAN